MKRYKKGFTIIEMLVVISILIILIAAGGFFYRDMRLKALNKKAQEEAANFAQVLNDIYKTGRPGTKESQHIFYDSYQFRGGAYPHTKGIDQGIENMYQEYGDKMPEKLAITDKYIVRISDDCDYKTAECYPLYTNETDHQKELEKRFGTVIYRPVYLWKTSGYYAPEREEPLDGTTYECATSGGEFYEQDVCEVAYIYYVGYENGQYVLVPYYKLRDGIAHRL